MKRLAITFTALLIALSAVTTAAQGPSPDSSDLLTAEEWAWLAAHPTIRLGVGIAFPPYQWVEKEDGEYVFKGVVSYYIQKLRLPNLKVAAPTGWNRIELSMGVRDDWPMLHAIIQKTIGIGGGYSLPMPPYYYCISKDTLKVPGI